MQLQRFPISAIERIEEFDTNRRDGSKGKDRRRLVMYNCTSGYPVPFPDVCMLEINRLNELYTHRVKEIAFSGHHLGIAIDIAAYTLGAKWIERHFTKDRTWKGAPRPAPRPAPLSRVPRWCLLFCTPHPPCIPLCRH